MTTFGVFIFYIVDDRSCATSPFLKNFFTFKNFFSCNLFNILDQFWNLPCRLLKLIVTQLSTAAQSLQLKISAERLRVTETLFYKLSTLCYKLLFGLTISLGFTNVAAEPLELPQCQLLKLNLNFKTSSSLKAAAGQAADRKRSQRPGPSGPA